MSRNLRAGLVLLGLLSLLDLLTPLLTNGEHPPMPVAVSASVLGVTSLVCVGAAWRGSSKAVVGLVALRLLSALAAVPAFFVAGVPAPAAALAAAAVVLTVVGVALCLSGSRRTSAVVAR